MGRCSSNLHAESTEARTRQGVLPGTGKACGFWWWEEIQTRSLGEPMTLYRPFSFLTLLWTAALLSGCADVNSNATTDDATSSDASSAGGDSGEPVNGDVVSVWEGAACDEGSRCDGTLILECIDGAWAAVSQCDAGASCDEDTVTCLPVACDLGERRCDGEYSIQFCSPDQTEWLEPQACPGQQVCLDGACLSPECYPGVLFMVDHSQSMLPQWDQVAESISRLMASNPSVRYGMLAFPNEVVDDNVCRSGNDWPYVTIGDDRGDDIATWLNDTHPDGATPLAASLQWVAQNAGTLWNGEEIGYLVILSDGGDSCSCKQVPVEERDQCLNQRFEQATLGLLNQNIRTYVVGYSYDDDTGGLDAIAANGGTGRDRYTYVGDEEELNSAFESIIREIKACQ